MIYELQVFTRTTFDSSNNIIGSGNSFQHNPKETLTLLLESENPYIGFYANDKTPQSVAEFLELKTGYSEDDLTEGTQLALGHITIVRTNLSAYDDNDSYLLAYLVTPSGRNWAYGSTYVLLPLNNSPPPPPGTRFYGTDYYQYSQTYQMTPQGGTAPCFTPGTLIETPCGPVAVEMLRPGDLVATRDHGPQVLRWRGEKRLTARTLDQAPNLFPIRIRAGALGAGVPARDLVVSPQHRVLVGSRIAQRLLGCGEALVAARHLLGLAGVSVDHPAGGLTYLHLGFEHHEIVRSEGMWTESFFPGPQALGGLSPAARREFLALFPQFRNAPPPGARRFLNGREGRSLAARHEKHGRALTESL